MSIMETQPQKILRSGWNAYVNDYAISGGWNYDGEVLIICDAEEAYTSLMVNLVK